MPKLKTKRFFTPTQEKKKTSQMGKCLWIFSLTKLPIQLEAQGATVLLTQASVATFTCRSKTEGTCTLTKSTSFSKGQNFESFSNMTHGCS